MPIPPQLIEDNFYSYNLIKYNEKFYGLKQSAGSIFLEKISDSTLKQLIAGKMCFVHENFDFLKIEILKITPGLLPQALKKWLKFKIFIGKILNKGPKKLYSFWKRKIYFHLGILLIFIKFLHASSKPKISILLPSRARSSRCREMVENTIQMAKNPYKIEFLILVDNDDADDYESELREVSKKFFIKVIRSAPNPISGARYNYLATIARGKILMYAADDIVIHTMHWDEVVYQKFCLFPDHILLCSDQGSEIPLHGFISKKSFELLGYIFPAYFQYGYNDIWLYEIYKKLNRHMIIKDLHIEHRHWHSHPELFDKTYAKVLSVDGKTNIINELDKKIFDSKEIEINQAVDNLKNFVSENEFCKTKNKPLNKEIYYPSNLLNSHYKITASHPFLRDFISNAPSGWTFKELQKPRYGYKFNKKLNKNNFYYKYFVRYAFLNGAKQINLNKFIEAQNTSTSLDSSDHLLMIPTYPQYFGPNNWFIEIEDWTTLFDPFILNGNTENIDIKNHPMFPMIKALLLMPNCRGIITHMNSTKLGLEYLFPELTNRKIFYVPPLYSKPVADKIQEHFEENVPVFTFLNSFCGQHRNFVVRGGREVLSAFNNLDKQGVDFKLVIRANLDFEQLDRDQQQFIFSEKVEWVRENISDEQIISLVKKSYAFLLPSYRIHALAILQAMANGIPIICSDGWGYDEFIEHGKNGLVVKGFRHKAYTDNDNVLRENYDGDSAESSEIILQIEKAVKALITNREYRNELAQNSLAIMKQKFSPIQWKNDLSNVLEKLLKIDESY